MLEGSIFSLKLKNDLNMPEDILTLKRDIKHNCPVLYNFLKKNGYYNSIKNKFINYDDDGFTVRKHIGLIETERAKERKAHLLNCWLHDAPAETKFMVKTTIEPEDEWLHSFYYFNDEIPKIEDFEKTIADYLTFEFSMIAQGKGYLFENVE